MLLAWRPPAFHYRTLRESGGEEEAGGKEKQPVVRLQREKIQSGRKKDKRFEGEGGVRVLH